jgi:GntR family transcriptional regulator, transcriptional repressor for pyruvate dehydrogenase complex
MKHDAGRVESVMRQIETALLDGTYPAHARLPAERMLAERYGVSRNTVREAIQRLAARGLLRSRQGAGVYVTEQLRTGTGSPSPWGQLIADHPGVRDDVLEFRRVLEGATAYFAALRSTEEDRERIRVQLAALEQARAAGDQPGEAAADARLHEAIALASHNTMFLHLHASVIGMLREHITANGSSLRAQAPEVGRQLLQQHRAVCDAICGARPDEAQAAMQAHIDYVAGKIALAEAERAQ